MNLATITTFLGWCAVINLSLLIFSSIMIILLKDGVTKIHGKMFGMSKDELMKAYFQYLAQYKIMALVFTVVPYLALKIMG